jgi:antibiotic biosynthesis monooxygenase (ABM) superfamily enzyme
MSGLVAGKPVYHALTGLETWFTLPSSGPIVPPPRYKMAIVTWLAVFPLATGVFYAAAPVFTRLPPIGRSLAMSVILVPVMTYIVMPRMTRLFRNWLYPDAPPAPEGKVSNEG